MTELNDSGERIIYDTGGTREPKERRCDLLPLEVFAVFRDDYILKCLNRYVREGNPLELWKAINVFCELNEWTFGEMAREVAIHYGQGAKKYADRNWELGIPLHSYIDSGLSHYFKWIDNLDDEPHDRAFVWNMLGAIWTHWNRPAMIDLPFMEKQNENNN